MDRDEPDAERLGSVALMSLAVGALLIVAAGVVGVSMGTGGGHAMMAGAHVPGTQRAVTVGFQLDGLPADIVENYAFAQANPGVYEQIPCFCGCQSMLGHRNLEDCFVTPGGLWESHASGCQICVEESQMVMRMMGRGVGPDAIREGIIAEFGGSIAMSG